MPARQRLEAPIKHVLKKGLPIWWMACRVRYSIVFSSFNVFVRNRKIAESTRDGYLTLSRGLLKPPRLGTCSD